MFSHIKLNYIFRLLIIGILFLLNSNSLSVYETTEGNSFSKHEFVGYKPGSGVSSDGKTLNNNGILFGDGENAYMNDDGVIVYASQYNAKATKSVYDGGLTIANPQKGDKKYKFNSYNRQIINLLPNFCNYGNAIAISDDEKTIGFGSYDKSKLPDDADNKDYGGMVIGIWNDEVNKYYFYMYTMQNYTNEVFSNYATSVSIDKDNEVVFGTSNGIGVAKRNSNFPDAGIKSHDWTWYDKDSEGNDIGNVNSISFDKNENIICTTDSKTTGKIHTESRNLYVGIRDDSGGYKFSKINNSPPFITSASISGNDYIVLGTQTSGVYLGTPKDLKEPNINDLKNGYTWNNFYDKNSKIPSNDITDVSMNNSNNFLVSTADNGYAAAIWNDKTQNYDFTVFDTYDTGIYGDDGTSASFGNDGTVVFSSKTGGISMSNVSDFSFNNNDFIYHEYNSQSFTIMDWRFFYNYSLNSDFNDNVHNYLEIAMTDSNSKNVCAVFLSAYDYYIKEDDLPYFEQAFFIHQAYGQREFQTPKPIIGKDGIPYGSYTITASVGSDQDNRIVTNIFKINIQKPYSVDKNNKNNLAYKIHNSGVGFIIVGSIIGFIILSISILSYRIFKKNEK